MGLFSSIKQIIKSQSNSISIQSTNSSNIVMGNVSGGDIIINGVKVNSSLKMVKGSGKVANIGIPLGEFDRIECSIMGDVKLINEMGRRSALIKCDDNFIDKLDISVKNRILNIGFKPNTHLAPKVPVEIVIDTQAKSIKSIIHEGAGTFSGEEIGEHDLFIEVSGAAQMELGNLNLDKLDVRSSGASTVSLSGKVSNLALEASGATQNDLAMLDVQEGKARISGASSAKLNCENSLEANVSGASKLTLMQEPALANVHTSGASSVTKKTNNKSPKF